MHHPRILPSLCGLIAGALAATPLAAATFADELADLKDSLVGGKPMANLRYRFENVDESTNSNDANASTLRAAIGYETKAYHGFSVLAQYEGIFAVGPQHYRDYPGSPTGAIYPVVQDPTGSALNQCYLRYQWPVGNNELNTKFGRQVFILNNARIVGDVAWRQNQQTFDGVSAVVAPMPELALTYAYFMRVNRVTGDARFTAAGAVGPNDGQLDLDAHIFNLAYKLPAFGSFKSPGSVKAYGALLDYDLVTANSSQTYGVRAEGPWPLTDIISLLYAAEYAKQSEYGSAPVNYDAHYGLGELGAAWKGLGAKLGYSLLSGASATEKFNTPLATGHAFNGWAEKFLITPNLGVQSWYLWLGGPLPQLVDGLSFAAVVYDFHSESGRLHYGHEYDAMLEYAVLPFDKNLVVGAKVGDYHGDDDFAAVVGAKNVTKFSLYTVYSF